MSTIPQPGNPSSKSLVIHLVEQLPDDIALDDISKQVATLASLHAKKAFDALGEIVDITRDLFGDRIEITRDADPEYPDEKYIRLTVEVSGPVADIVMRESEWAKRVCKVEPKADAFKLSFRRKHEP